MTLKMGHTDAATSAKITSDNDRVWDIDEKLIQAEDKKVPIKSADLATLNDDDEAARSRICEDENRQNIEESENDEFFVKYQDKTYEISKFFKKHPGGRRTLTPYRGLPLDKILKRVPHSDAAFHLFEEFVVDNQPHYDDIENLVDWNAPLLGQVGRLADRYWEWVNLPVNRSIRLFESDFLEYLTITPWYLVPIVWIPITLCFLYFGFVTNNSRCVQNSVPEMIIAVSCGLLLWTLIEYVLHRNLFHMKPPANNKALITLHFLLHGLHHKIQLLGKKMYPYRISQYEAPFDDQRLLFPPVPAVLIAAIVYNLYKAVLPDVMIDFVAAGTMTGYLCYDLIHYYLHHGSPRAESYLYVMKRYHNYHHFSHHDHGFGISSRLWDFVFGSLIRLNQLKRAIVW